MSSNYIDSILPKYQAESAAANLVNYNTQARSMYPYVSVTSHQLSSTPATNMSPFTAMTASTEGDKQCRYSQTGATDMSQYGLNLQNCATTSNMAQYFHQNNVTNPLNSCSQPTATPHIPDIPRYPWMSITGAPSMVVATHLTTETCANTRLPLLPSSGRGENHHISTSPLQSETRTKDCETLGESPTLQTRYKRFKHCTSAISTPGARGSTLPPYLAGSGTWHAPYL
ncbi:Homeotic protein abdominal A [Chionoecetes opilio]|uniref:Homeotic protein abdominal A n=1 Tax=Chionoecetes opilio TaxID=41210 RepID=A0A8J5E7X5_CHIOP|nr:Homeotic protein abdominal A [Chionoecetes opilio]